MGFTDNVLSLISTKGISINRMLKDLGMGAGTFATWQKRGTIPSGDSLTKIANYFGVSTDYLLGNEQKNEPTLTEKDERDISKRLDQTLSDLENSQGALMFDGEPLDDVTKELLIASLRKDLEMGKRIAKQKYTPKKYRKPE